MLFLSFLRVYPFFLGSVWLLSKVMLSRSYILKIFGQELLVVLERTIQMGEWWVFGGCYCFKETLSAERQLILRRYLGFDLSFYCYGMLYYCSAQKPRPRAGILLALGFHTSLRSEHFNHMYSMRTVFTVQKPFNGPFSLLCIVQDA